MKTKKKRRSYPWHDHEKFVRIWQKADSLKEVAEKYGTTPEGASSTAHNLRGKGVKLKDFRSSRGRTDYKKLVALAAGMQ